MLRSSALAGLCGGTALLGLVLVGIGRARLTWLVSYLPMPVLGGYLYQAGCWALPFTVGGALLCAAFLFLLCVLCVLCGLRLCEYGVCVFHPCLRLLCIN